MKCYYCPLASSDDVCPECEGKYGIEFKDGSLGCRHPRNWVEKRDSEYTEHLGEMGTDMGIEMDFSKSDLDRLLEICKHMVGLDYASPYHRHGNMKIFSEKFVILPISRLARMVGFFAKQTVALMRRIE